MDYDEMNESDLQKMKAEIQQRKENAELYDQSGGYDADHCTSRQTGYQGQIDDINQALDSQRQKSNLAFRELFGDENGGQ